MTNLTLYEYSGLQLTKPMMANRAVVPRLARGIQKARDDSAIGHHRFRQRNTL